MSRRTLHIVCGIAVLFASVVYAHVFYHVFFVAHHGWNADSAPWIIISAIAGVFCFVGAYLLLTGGRGQAPN